MTDFTLLPLLDLANEPGGRGPFTVAGGAALRLFSDLSLTRTTVLNNLTRQMTLDGGTIIHPTVAVKRHQVDNENLQNWQGPPLPPGVHAATIPRPQLTGDCLIHLIEQARQEEWMPLLYVHHNVFRNVIDQHLFVNFSLATGGCLFIDYGDLQGYLGRLLNVALARGGPLLSHNQFCGFINSLLRAGLPTAELADTLTLIGPHRWELTFIDHVWDVLPDGRSLLQSCRYSYHLAGGPAGLLDSTEITFNNAVTQWGMWAFRYMSPPVAQALSQQRLRGPPQILLPPGLLAEVDRQMARAFLRRDGRRVNLTFLLQGLIYHGGGIVLNDQLVLRPFGGGIYRYPPLPLVEGDRIDFAVFAGGRQLYWAEEQDAAAHDQRVRTRLHRGVLQIRTRFTFDGDNLAVPALFTVLVPRAQLHPLPGGPVGDIVLRLAQGFNSPVVAQRAALLPGDLTIVEFILPPDGEDAAPQPPDSDSESSDSDDTSEGALSSVGSKSESSAVNENDAVDVGDAGSNRSDGGSDVRDAANSAPEEDSPNSGEDTSGSEEDDSPMGGPVTYDFVSCVWGEPAEGLDHFFDEENVVVEGLESTDTVGDNTLAVEEGNESSVLEEMGHRLLHLLVSSPPAEGAVGEGIDAVIDGAELGDMDNPVMLNGVNDAMADVNFPVHEEEYEELHTEVHVDMDDDTNPDADNLVNDVGAAHYGGALLASVINDFGDIDPHWPSNRSSQFETGVSITLEESPLASHVDSTAIIAEAELKKKMDDAWEEYRKAHAAYYAIASQIPGRRLCPSPDPPRRH